MVRQLLSEPENWFSVRSKSSYQLPGVFPTPIKQQLYFTSDISDQVQSCKDSHFIWKDIQLSKGALNKDRLIKDNIQGKMESLHFRSSLCSGVRYVHCQTAAMLSQYVINRIVHFTTKHSSKPHAAQLILYICTLRIRQRKGAGLVV